MKVLSSKENNDKKDNPLNITRAFNPSQEISGRAKELHLRTCNSYRSRFKKLAAAREQT
jgi:hypothetical protein